MTLCKCTVCKALSAGDFNARRERTPPEGFDKQICTPSTICTIVSLQNMKCNVSLSLSIVEARRLVGVRLSLKTAGDETGAETDLQAR